MKKNKKILIILIFMLIMLTSIFFFEYGNDYYWHTRIGKYIFDNKNIPFIDCFSWYGSLHKLNWISHEWLFELIINIFDTIFNKNGAIIYVTIIMLINSYLIFSLNKKRFYENTFNTIIWALIRLMTLCSFILPRPHLISYTFFILLLLFIKKILEDENSKLIYITPLIVLLWVNIHGGSSNLSYILLGMTILSSIIPIKKRISINKKQLLKLLYAFITSILFITINPHGLKMIIYPYQNITYNTMINCIDEWQSINLTSINSICYIILILCLLLTLLKNINKINIFEILLILAFSILSIKSIRFIPFLFIISTSIVPNYWKNNKIIINEKAILVFLLIMYTGFIYTYKLPRFKIVNDDMIKYLKSNKNTKLYNSYNLGGYLIYKDIKPFIDSRADMYVKTTLCDICKIEKDNNYKVLEKYNFDTFIVENKSSTHRYLSKNKKYKKILSDNNNSIFILKEED